MSYRRLVAAAVVALVVLPAFTGRAEAPAGNAAARASEKAVFSVPGIKDEAVVRSLTSALAKQPGVVAAKPDAGNGKLAVTFDPAKTGVDALTKLVVRVVPQATLDKVEAGDAKAAKPDCSKCPSKSKCAKEGR